VQVLAVEIKREVVLRKHFNTSREGGGPRHSIQKPSVVNASFGHRLHGSGQQYPVWETKIHNSRSGGALSIVKRIPTNSVLVLEQVPPGDPYCQNLIAVTMGYSCTHK
jgi:hypothetical protein